MRTHDQGPSQRLQRVTSPLLPSHPSTLTLKAHELSWGQEIPPSFQFPGLSRFPELEHRVFTRQGGASASPYESLNASYSVGDVPEKVTENLETIGEQMGAERLVFVNQSHGDKILVVQDGQNTGWKEVPSADAMITNKAGTALMVKLADCQGVILFDPARRVVATAHCGWRGNVKSILGKVVKRMTEEFGSSPSVLFAAVSPSLGPCCAEFNEHFKIFPKVYNKWMVRENYFDLWAISRWQLLDAGLREENIEVAGICTRCRTDLFYSYRGEGKTGRFATVAMLR